MKFSKLLVAVLSVLVASFTSVGCGGLADPHIRIKSDFAGRAHRLGSTISLEWECEECEQVSGSSVVVELMEEGGRNSLGRAVVGPLSGHADWNCATVMPGQRAIAPGRYQLSFSTYPPNTGTNGGNERLSASVLSGTFDLTQ